MPVAEDGCWAQWGWVTETDQKAVDVAAASNRCWTMLEGESRTVLVSGKHRVNRLYYVITREPWDRDYEVPGIPHEPDAWEPSDVWEEHPEYSVETWIEQVMHGDTRTGYIDWVNHHLTMPPDDDA